jgi:hypothetical protein
MYGYALILLVSPGKIQQILQSLHQILYFYSFLFPLEISVNIYDCFMKLTFHQDENIVIRSSCVFWSKRGRRIRVMVLNATFNNISVISWWSVLLVNYKFPEKITNLSQVTDKLHIMLYRVHLAWEGLELTTSVVICTYCIGSKCYYNTITTTKILCY